MVSQVGKKNTKEFKKVQIMYMVPVQKCSKFVLRVKKPIVYLYLYSVFVGRECEINVQGICKACTKNVQRMYKKHKWFVQRMNKKHKMVCAKNVQGMLREPAVYWPKKEHRKG